MTESLSLSPLSLFLHAGLVGKAVTIVLLGMSVWCWVLIVEGLFSIAILRNMLGAKPSEQGGQFLEMIRCSGGDALQIEIDGENSGEKRLRVSEAMQRAGSALFIRAERGLPALAIISSISPFIGLFGTVWGIMTSFAGIAEAKDTSLAIVAPGIAEALAATAYGLAAAIPAAVGYNKLNAELARANQRLIYFVDAEAINLISSRKASS